MKILIIYDSVFGNTERIALAMRDALAAGAELSLLRADAFVPASLEGLDLLLIGSPTRAFRPTKAVVAVLGALPRLKGLPIAAFDTRIDIAQVESRLLTFMAGIFGYAAKSIERQLIRKGGSPAGEAGAFIVGGSEGPLLEGEGERAITWAMRIAAAARTDRS